jgi:hypothetical protein
MAGQNQFNFLQDNGFANGSWAGWRGGTQGKVVLAGVDNPGIVIRRLAINLHVNGTNGDPIGGLFIDHELIAALEGGFIVMDTPYFIRKGARLHAGSNYPLSLSINYDTLL